jgi:hypothetical protein
MPPGADLVICHPERRRCKLLRAARRLAIHKSAYVATAAVVLSLKKHGPTPLTQESPMKRNIFSGLLVAALTSAVAIFAISGQARALSLSSLLGGGSENVPGLKLIHAGDLSAMLARHMANLYVYDANPSDVRTEYGVIPGARMLPSADGYNVAETLPPNKRATLVFYCHNQH